MSSLIGALMLVGLKGSHANAAYLSSPDGELHLRVESARENNRACRQAILRRPPAERIRPENWECPFSLRALEEVEVAALIGLQDVFHVELGVAATRSD